MHGHLPGKIKTHKSVSQSEYSSLTSDLRRFNFVKPTSSVYHNIRVNKLEEAQAFGLNYLVTSLEEHIHNRSILAPQFEMMVNSFAHRAANSDPFNLKYNIGEGQKEPWFG